MVIRWLFDDYLMVIRWLFDDYLTSESAAARTATGSFIEESFWHCGTSCHSCGWHQSSTTIFSSMPCLRWGSRSASPSVLLLEVADPAVAQRLTVTITPKILSMLRTACATNSSRTILIEPCRTKRTSQRDQDIKKLQMQAAEGQKQIGPLQFRKPFHSWIFLQHISGI